MGIYKPQQSGFPEIGGAGELIYTSVRFSGYELAYDPDGTEFIRPILDDEHRPVVKKDYDLKGHVLLYELANLYKRINSWEDPVDSRKAVMDWCSSHIHPFNTIELADACRTLDGLDDNTIRIDGSFTFDEFMDKLSRLSCTLFYHHALRSARLDRDTSLARMMYYEGRFHENYPFFERYRNLEDDEYLARLDEDYPSHLRNLLDCVPPFEMTLQVNEDSGRVGMYAHIDTLFDICWFALSRIIATDAPPEDSDDDGPLHTNKPYICCKACGTYLVKTGIRQQYCGNPDCQRVRNRKKQKEHYERQKLKKAQNAD
ncbi:MAG: hypothetical protein KBS81_08845 [Spirochaetales bacterium]|nr:hypothetical protein [Candidatus Physcosoma equi]